MLILSSEDIGMQTQPLLLWLIIHSKRLLYYPESRIILSQCAIYLATSPKSNASYLLWEGTTTSKTNGDLSVPIHLRNAPTKLMKELGYGEEYKYSHDYQNILQTKNTFQKH
jgi:putative ATPase